VSRHLTSTDFYTCAAPGYIEEHGAPCHPSDLADHPYIAFRTAQSNDEVTFQDSGDAAIAVHPKPVFITQQHRDGYPVPTCDAGVRSRSSSVLMRYCGDWTATL
jgi:hypothetical protein